MSHHMKHIRIHGKDGGHIHPEHAAHHPHYGHVHRKATDTTLGGGAVHAQTNHTAAFNVGYKRGGANPRHGSGAHN